MTDQQDNFLDDLPDGWVSDRLKDVVALRREKTNAASENKDYLELEDFESGTGRILNRRDTTNVKSAVTLFERGDVLFGKLRPYLAKYYQAEFDGKCTGEIIAMKPERILGRFLFYCVGSHWFIERCNGLAYGAKMPRVNWSTQLSQFVIPLPPLHEQKTIASYLDLSCEAIDLAVAAKRRQVDILEGVRDDLIESIITKGIDNAKPTKEVAEDWIIKIPSHWSLVRIKRLVSRVDYGISQGTVKDGRYPVLKMGNIENREIQLTDIEYVDEDPDDLLLEQGDLLYNRTNSPELVAKAAIYRGTKSDETTFASYLVRLRTNHRANPYYLNYLVNSRGFLSFARRLAIPSVQQSNLNSTRYCRVLVPLPPLDEQQDLLKFLDERMAELDGAVTGIKAQIDTLISYRKSMINECLTGQRLISEADLVRAKSFA